MNQTKTRGPGKNQLAILDRLAVTDGNAFAALSVAELAQLMAEPDTEPTPVMIRSTRTAVKALVERGELTELYAARGGSQAQLLYARTDLLHLAPPPEVDARSMPEQSGAAMMQYGRGVSDITEVVEQRVDLMPMTVRDVLSDPALRRQLFDSLMANETTKEEVIAAFRRNRS